MKVIAYCCDGCGAMVKSKDEFETSLKVPSDKKNKKGEPIKAVKQLCKKCAVAFQDKIKSFFKQ